MACIGQALYRALQRNQHDAALIELVRGQAKHSYSGASILSLALQRASQLQALFPRQSEQRAPVAMVAMEAGSNCLLTILGCIFAGVTMVPLPVPKLPAEQRRVERILAMGGADGIVSDAANSSYFRPWQQQIRCLSLDLDNLSSFVKEPIFPCWSADQPVMIQFTSGSTDDPKGVLISSENILANHAKAVPDWRFSGDKVFLNWLPYYHDMGLFGGLLYPLLSGMQLLLMRPTDFIKKPLVWLQAISDYRVNYSGGPAFAYQLCCDRVGEDELSKLNLSSWQMAFCGADYVPHAVLERFRQHFLPAQLSPYAVIACYGLAESTLYVAGHRLWPDSDDLQQFAQRRSAHTTCEGCYVGEHLPDVKIGVDDDAALISEPAVGPIYIRGASVSRGYWQPSSANNAHAEQRQADSVWLDTGDLGFIENGYLFITGRRKQLLVVHGRNLLASDLIASACSCDNALNPLAALVSQRAGGSNLYLLVEKKTKALLDEAQLVEQMQHAIFEHFGVSMAAIKILPRGALERTSSGKVQIGQPIARWIKDLSG